MGIFDKAKDLIGGNAKKVEDGIDKAADMAKDKVGEEHADKIDQAAEKAKDVVDKLDNVGAALTDAIDAQMNDGRSTVIEIMCTQELGEPFRKDALSKPVRFLPQYKDYV